MNSNLYHWKWPPLPPVSKNKYSGLNLNTSQKIEPFQVETLPRYLTGVESHSAQ